MSDLRTKVKLEFEKADTEKKGEISTSQLGTLLKSLNPDISDSELAQITAKVGENGVVKMNKFLDVFCPDPPGLRRELSKPVKPEELKVMEDAFKKFDKSGDGKLNLNELQAMCSELGKKLNDQQARAAMKQLDRNGDETVDFDEFVLWWTCTPGLGGYDHVALKFMKAKLALKYRLHSTLAKVQRKKVDNPNEFAWKGSFDITPNYLAGQGCEEKMSVSLAVKKGEPTNADGLTFTIKCKAKDGAAAVSVKTAWVSFLDRITEMGEDVSNFVKATNEGDMLIYTFNLPAEAWGGAPDDLKEMLPILEGALKKVEFKVSSGANFEEMVKNPLKPLPQQFRGVKVSGDVLIALETLTMMAMQSDCPPPLQMAIKVFAGWMAEAKIGFDDTAPMEIVNRLKDMMKDGVDYMDPPDKLFYECMDKGLGTMRNKLHKLASTPCHEGGMDIIKSDGSDFNYDSMPDEDGGKKLWAWFLESNKSLTGIESITLVGIPDSPLEFHVSFDQFNPFALGQYICGSWPKSPEGDDSNALSKPMSDDENQRLKDVFKKFDTSGDDKIDIKELKTMIVELGGTISDEEAEEAMKQLDKNGDGTCCFAEFKEFWCSKSGLGGYGNAMLKFLKMKLAAGSLASKGRAVLSNASGFVGLSDGLSDTLLKWTSEFTPGMAELTDEKMSISAFLDVEDVKKDEPPRVSLVLSAKSEAEATECVAKIKETLAPFEEMLQMMDIPVPDIKSDGANIVISLSPPEEMLQQLYMQEDMMKFLTPAIKAVRNSFVKVGFANSFDDLNNDENRAKPVPELFAGTKITTRLSASAFGKGMLFKLIERKKKSIERNSGPGAAGMLIDMLRLFTGAEVNTAMGWHKSNLTDVMGMLSSMGMEPFLSSKGLRETLPNFAPPGEALPDEGKLVGAAAVEILKKLDGIQSLTLENVALPKEFSQNGLDATVAVRVTCDNVKPFALANWILEPSIEKVGLLSNA